MEIIEKINTLTSLEKLTYVALVLMFCWVLEAGIPLIQLEYNKAKHTFFNFIFLSTSTIINLFFAIALSGVFLYLDEFKFGLLRMVNWPTWLEVLVGIMALDLVSQYFVHALLHHVPLGWRFHMVHHSDTYVDASTGTRHHPLDYFIRELFAYLGLFIIGAPLSVYLLYRVISIFSTYFTHANIMLPTKIDRFLSLLFVTPNMHKFHHHIKAPWTDRNFGNVFSLWDRVFGTMQYGDPKQVIYGLDTADPSKSSSLSYQFMLPFIRNSQKAPRP